MKNYFNLLSAFSILMSCSNKNDFNSASEISEDVNSKISIIEMTDQNKEKFFYDNESPRNVVVHISENNCLQFKKCEEHNLYIKMLAEFSQPNSLTIMHLDPVNPQAQKAKEHFMPTDVRRVYELQKSVIMTYKGDENIFTGDRTFEPKFMQEPFSVTDIVQFLDIEYSGPHFLNDGNFKEINSRIEDIPVLYVVGDSQCHYCVDIVKEFPKTMKINQGKYKIVKITLDVGPNQMTNNEFKNLTSGYPSLILKKPGTSYKFVADGFYSAGDLNNLITNELK